MKRLILHPDQYAQGIERVYDYLLTQSPDKPIEVVIQSVKGNRTELQNNSMYKYFELLADALNNAGLDMKIVLAHQAEIPWTKTSVKERLWRPVQRALLNKESTTELDTSDPSMVYDVLNRHFSEKWGIYVAWPSKESLRSNEVGTFRQ